METALHEEPVPTWRQTEPFQVALVLDLLEENSDDKEEPDPSITPPGPSRIASAGSASDPTGPS